MLELGLGLGISPKDVAEQDGGGEPAPSEDYITFNGDRIVHSGDPILAPGA